MMCFSLISEQELPLPGEYSTLYAPFASETSPALKIYYWYISKGDSSVRYYQ